MYKDIIDTIGFVESYDPELGAAMQRELGRQRQNIELCRWRPSSRCIAAPSSGS